MSRGPRPLVPSRIAPGGVAHGGRRTPTSRIGGFVALTKPRIIELLLITTVPTMVMAEQGWPSTWLVVVTLIAGTLAAGGANTVNMVIDRDIFTVDPHDIAATEVQVTLLGGREVYRASGFSR